ncbi:MAG: acyl-CoA dehydrogenase [Dehalococcoidia bacterium]|nr:acyl-CoA dehydrogenase [Dehalococcoidia bacterium]
MDFRFTSQQLAFRQEVREWLKKELPPGWAQSGGGEEGGDSEGSFETTRDFRRRMAVKGWLTLAWPKEYGGMGADALTQMVFNEEISYHRAPGPDNGVFMLGSTLILSGSEELKRRFLPAIARHEYTWCQGYSEPEAGSDLASLQTRGVEDGDDFVINGSKIWTSNAHNADMIFMLVRTDPTAQKHRGITFLIADMKSPGITVRPIVNMAGIHSFNQVFFDNVRVPKSNMVGEKNRGWYVATTLLDFERSGIAGFAGARRTLEDLFAFAKENKKDGRPLADDPFVRKSLAERWIEAEAGTLMSYNVASMQAQGKAPNKESSIVKLFGTELRQRIAQTGMDLIGMYGQLGKDSKWAPLNGRLSRMWMSSFSATLAGGTSEIQRGIIATRGLGLPRG